MILAGVEEFVCDAYEPKRITMPKHKWKFKSHFRRGAYGWNGTSKASTRMKEAVSEIKKVAKKDSALAGEGTIELFVRLYPALMDIDSSSGALGTAMNKTIDSLMPILVKADWDMNTRGKQLDKLYDAIIEDGWGTFDSLRDYWGDLCVYPDLAHLWADQFMDCTKDVLSSTNKYCSAVDMCLSCLVYAERFSELKELLELDERHSWFHHKFWAMALVKQGKQQEALDYAEQLSLERNADYENSEINQFCESTLIDMGKAEEAYEKYGLKIQSYGTNLNIYRSICKKYPSIDKKKILLDCIEKKGDEGKWFASAKNAGFLDIAVQCAKSDGSDPNTLLRACRDFSDKDFPFALVVGVLAIIRLMTGTFYEEVTATDIGYAYQQVEHIAKDNGKLADFKSLLIREMMKHHCAAHLRAAVVKRLEMG